MKMLPFVLVQTLLCAEAGAATVTIADGSNLGDSAVVPAL
jgi:hypothetical protein